MTSLRWLEASGKLQQQFLLASRSLSIPTQNVREVLKQSEEYKEQLKNLRKQWHQNHLNKVREEETKREDEDKKVVLRSAKLLRTKRKLSEKKREKHEKVLQAVKLRYDENIARNIVKKEQEEEVFKKKFDQMVKEMDAESKYWVTKENMMDKINEKLFLRPATTGVVFHNSEYWRDYCITTNIHRLIQVANEENDIDSFEEKLQAIGEKDALSKEDMLQAINQMIGTGEERARYDEIVHDMSTKLRKDGKPEDSDDDVMESSNNESEDEIEGYEERGLDEDDVEYSEEDSNGEEKEITAFDRSLRRRKLREDAEMYGYADAKIQDPAIIMGKEFNESDVTSEDSMNLYNQHFKSIDQLIQEINEIDPKDTITLKQKYNTLITRIRTEEKFKKLTEEIQPKKL